MTRSEVFVFCWPDFEEVLPHLCLDSRFVELERLSNGLLGRAWTSGALKAPFEENPWLLLKPLENKYSWVAIWTQPSKPDLKLLKNVVGEEIQIYEK